MNILFTSGGSDTENSTLKFLKLFKFINSKSIKLFILLGPNFQKLNIKKIKNICIKEKFNVKFLEFKKNIYSNIFDKDLVITSSGLTKYDLLQFKKPFVVFSENNNQKKINERFKFLFYRLYFDDLSYCKKNLTRLNKIINNKRYINSYNDKVNNIKMNDFKTIYNFIKK